MARMRSGNVGVSRGSAPIPQYFSSKLSKIVKCPTAPRHSRCRVDRSRCLSHVMCVWLQINFYLVQIALPLHSHVPTTRRCTHISFSSLPKLRMSSSTSRRQYTLTRATEEDLSTLSAIELDAVSVFSRIPELAGFSRNQVPAKQLESWISNGRIYIANDSGRPVGFVAAVPMDTTFYIAEICTIPDYQGQGVGGILIEAVFAWARETAVPGQKTRVSLTTYREVPWNGPWYLKRGFKEVDAETLGPKHVAKMVYDREERKLVRPGYTRCCMLWEEG
jgi:GNAT superfamily N-acetyltransferase